MKRYEAIKMRKIIVESAASLNDQTASEAPELFNSMKYDGKLIPAGTRINWQGILKRASVDLWDLEINNPDNAPSLWEDILYKDGIRIIPETITSGTAFMIDEQGWWKEKIYKSLIDNNVWNPEQNPSGWQNIE